VRWKLCSRRPTELELLGAQEHPVDAFDADLVGDPGLVGAGGEREADAPQHLGGEDREECGRQPLEQEAGADQHEADDDREPAAVEVGDDAGRDLEEEAGELESGPDEHHLERVQSGVADVAARPGTTGAGQALAWRTTRCAIPNVNAWRQGRAGPGASASE
jgi:hypothetical protein